MGPFCLIAVSRQITVFGRVGQNWLDGAAEMNEAQRLGPMSSAVDGEGFMRRRPASADGSRGLTSVGRLDVPD